MLLVRNATYTTRKPKLENLSRNALGTYTKIVLSVHSAPLDLITQTKSSMDISYWASKISSCTHG